MPPFYIGSTSIDKLKTGYRGSVSSHMYKSLWLHELEHNPHLFKTIIIHRCMTRKQATERENVIQRAFNAKESPMYINRAYANGYYYSRRHTAETKKKMSQRVGSMLGKKHKLSSIEKMSRAHKGKILSEQTKMRLSASHTGKSYKKWDLNEEQRKHISEERRQRVWWNDGVKNRMSPTCPDNSGRWVRGRIYSRKPKTKVIAHAEN